MSVDAFDLFCAYHLGITAENTYAFQNAPQVARRFGLDPADLDAQLKHHGLHPDQLIRSDFDLAGAQADIQLSPPGVDLTVLARMHYEMFLEADPEGRDWDAELQQAADENDAIFGRKD